MAFMKQPTFVLHDETVNTYGFRMLTGGANLEEFRKNPVILLNHKDWELPIGRWENIRIEGTQILADALFDEKDDIAVKIAGKVEGGFLRMASMGAWPPEEARHAEAVRLVDAAIADGRIHAAGKEAYLKLFDADFENTRATLDAIPRRQSVTGRIREGERQQATELSDLAGKSWNELDKAGRLVELKDKAPELYREKFKAEFGTEPNM